MKAFGRIGLVAALAAATLTAGCTTIKDKRGYVAEDVLLNSVQPGIDNKSSVEGSLGRPTFASKFGADTWYYVTSDTRQKPFRSPKIKDHSVFAVHFDPRGNVISTERSGMERVVKLDPEGDKTPVLGKDRSFFEDLFGNIGAVGAAAPSGS
ncbi:putative small protein A [Caenibius tardaugens NBRC 16725]|uniref:Putative small protein A n=1 Tax=Caenibius tardaugens NBRC 16725 TaxID=1219035 RepID=U2Y794_9SPHN|nr:outer membrane protein assembly factor BamE [Caenibius tardaugens]AZI38187.1 outer membrane protein assembly factor BamE [Caenibius tardaugens NBRC 16725]GAD49071.1 putative small protein A [Caenibius tardaugens NBRC 16725]